MIAAMLILLALTAAPLAIAAERTAVLSVPGMNCASCPYIVEAAISDVPGVREVDASLEDKRAVVVFDDTATSVADIQAATTSVGFVSTQIEAESGS